jgi:two-component system chemotaxis response regulator CheB
MTRRGEQRHEDFAPAAAHGVRLPVAVLAASTGGPSTLMKLMPQFRAGFPAALLVVQHMPGCFTAQFAEQLASVSQIPVKHAVHGEELRAGHAYVCPGDCHLRVAPPGRIVLDAGPHIAGYRPSIDVTLESVAALAGANAVAAILTGMGNDGARGVLAIRQNGGLVLAQDETTSVIFGMPSEAIRSGAVHQVLPLEQIAAAVNRRVEFHLGAAKMAGS